MSKRFKKLRIAVAAVAILAALVYLNNAPWLADPIGTRPFLVAHRGLAQDFSREGLTGKTCTAARMIPAGHEYLENTLPSMAAAFELGADAVEFDIHRTVDDHFAVFHDWSVDCRTEGSGVTHEHTLAALQHLDIGYGYTADGGRTFPFRGKGVGMLPSLAQVLAEFPDRQFVIDLKSNDPEDGVLLAERLGLLNAERRAAITAYGGPRAIAEVRERLPRLRTITRPRLKRCLKRYIALGWSGHVPSECAHALLTVPANVAPWLWGWPNRFLQRMDRVGARVVLIGDYGGEGFSRGFDDPERVAQLPEDYSGGIWTDRIDRIAPIVRKRSR